MESEKRWYVIHTYSGYENKVTANLERKIHSLGMENEIFKVLVPMEDEVEVKDGKKKVTSKKVFPGYVLVEMIVNDRSWYAVRNTPGVTGFVGSGSKPIPLTDVEVTRILGHMGIANKHPKIDIKLQPPCHGESIHKVKHFCFWFGMLHQKTYLSLNGRYVFFLLYFVL